MSKIHPAPARNVLGLTGILALAVAAGQLPAQRLSVSISPDPAPTGVPITVTAWDASGLGLFTPGGCLIGAVRSGGPTGPSIALFPCTLLPVAIPPCGSPTPRTGTWNQNGATGPGFYWIEILTSVGPFAAVTSEYHCVTLQGAVAAATLSAVNPPAWGSTFQMALNAPANGVELYFVALALSTNTGIPLGTGQLICLDPDALFNLSFPSPDPLLFSGFQGITDAFGAASGIVINIPLAPSLGCLPVHAQAALLSSASVVTLTNDLHFTIQ